MQLERGPPSCPWVSACSSGYWLESVEKQRADMGSVGSEGCLVSRPTRHSQAIEWEQSGCSCSTVQTGWDAPGTPNAKLPRCCVAEAGPDESADGRANCGHGHRQTGFAMLSTQQSWGLLLGRAGERALLRCLLGTRLGVHFQCASFCIIDCKVAVQRCWGSVECKPHSGPLPQLLKSVPHICRPRPPRS